MNVLILSVGTRNLLVSYFTKAGFKKVVATDASELAPALKCASSYYLVPRITDPNYINVIKDICIKENINVILPLFEDELTLIAQNKTFFQILGILVVVSDLKTVNLCRDKYKFYEKLHDNNVPVLKTYSNCNDFECAYNNGSINFPVFIKPRNGCGSANSFKANNMEFVKAVLSNYDEEFIIQEFSNGVEYGVDVYVDLISKEPTSMFIKKKLRMRAGETEKSISIFNPEIEELVFHVLRIFKFNGPIDIDLFEIDGKFYVSEINPRFGGGYPHAYLCGIDFPKFILNNAEEKQCKKSLRNYKAGVIALKTQNIVCWGLE